MDFMPGHSPFQNAAKYSSSREMLVVIANFRCSQTSGSRLQAHYIIKSTRGMSVTIIDIGNDPALVIRVLPPPKLLPVFISASVHRQASDARMRCRIVYDPDITSIFRPHEAAPPLRALLNTYLL